MILIPENYFNIDKVHKTIRELNKLKKKPSLSLRPEIGGTGNQVNLNRSFKH
jgi:hypothetical protein